jgi:hypothetical protein
MKMIAHEHIGMKGDVKLPRVLAKQSQHILVVSHRQKDHLAVVTALYDVVRVARQGKTGQAGHENLSQRQDRSILLESDPHLLRTPISIAHGSLADL